MPPFFEKCYFKRTRLSLSYPRLSSLALSISLSAPPHPHPIPLSLSRSLHLSPSLTETDVGQCVWSLSGAAESLRAPRLVLIEPCSGCRRARAEDTAPWAT